jgi:peroxiredoxin
MLEVGDIAPDFSCEDDMGEKVCLNDYKGKKIVLYFYPRDNTPGCTKQACFFRDNMEELTKYNAIVIGVSKDSVKSHQNFKNKHELNFLLLADQDKKMCNDYGVWVEKKMYGKTSMGILRSTFLINEEGKIEKIWKKVKVQGHVEEVIEALTK